MTESEIVYLLANSVTLEVFSPQRDIEKKNPHSHEKKFSQSKHLNSLPKTYSLENLVCHEKLFTCGKKFECPSEIKRHLRNQFDETPFFHDSNLKRHVRILPKDGLYFCNRCGNSFSEIHDLNRHLRIHSGEKPFQCVICGRPFSQNSNLKRHIRIHSKDRPSSCYRCGKSFSETHDLKKHLQIHLRTDIGQDSLCKKEPTCKICGKKFRHPSELRRHLRTHSDERPFKCKICGRPFSQNSNLKRHMRVHSKDRP